MDVILLERIEKLGQMGDTVTVKTGFARNFLLPQNKALRATPRNLERFEASRAELEARNLEARKEAEGVAVKMATLKPVLIRAAGESGQLYGSVSSRDIVEILVGDGVSVSRSQIILDRPIKTLGLQEVNVRLHPEVVVAVVVNVARSPDEAETQFKTGEALIGDQNDEPVIAEEDFADEVEMDAEAAEDADEASEDAAEEAEEKA